MSIEPECHFCTGITKFRCKTQAQANDCVTYKARVKLLDKIKKDKELENLPSTLPDGSLFFTANLPLPDDHWIYEDNYYDEPLGCFSFLAPTTRKERKEFEIEFREGLKRAIRSSTMNGTEDFDPDALLQNICVETFGYYPIESKNSTGLPPTTDTMLELIRDED